MIAALNNMGIVQRTIPFCFTKNKACYDSDNIGWVIR